MADLLYNGIYEENRRKQHLVISLKRYSEGLLAYEREKENEKQDIKSYVNRWKKIKLQNSLGQPSNSYIYMQESKCFNEQKTQISTICNYSLDSLYFSIHLPESSLLVKNLQKKNIIPTKVNLFNKKFNLIYEGKASFESDFCIYPIVEISIENVSRYLQKPENWTCSIMLRNKFFEFNLTGNLPTEWS